MKLFKNFQTKRQLREENKRLKFLLNRPEPIHIVEREVQKVCSSIKLSGFALEIPTEDIKKQILYNIENELEPFIEWDIGDNSDQYRCGKILIGSIYVALRKE